MFSERCTLKDIKLTSGTHHVIKRYDILDAVRQNAGKAGVRLSKEKIDALYQKLYPLTQADNAKKMMHIQNVRNKKQGDGTGRKAAGAGRKEAEYISESKNRRTYS